MNRGRRWYKKEEYQKPLALHELGDGSMLEVSPEQYKGNPFALKLTRVWPDDRVSTIYLDPPRPGLNPRTVYLFVDDPAPKEQAQEWAANGFKMPHAITSAVPGQKPGDNYHAGTDREYDSRQEFERYFKENNYELVGPSDAKNLSTGSQPEDDDGMKSVNHVTAYDVRKPMPVPSQFAGKKFYYGRD